MKLRLVLLLSSVTLLSSSQEAPAAQPGADRLAVGSVPSQIDSVERVGRADPLEPMDRVLLVLSSKDPEGRRRFLDAQQTPGAPEYHRWLSPAEFHARFGARPEDVAAAEAWLAEQGFSVETGHPGRTAILFSGNVAQIEAAFETRIGLYAEDGQPIVANELPATLPAVLASRVVGVASLHGFAKKQPLTSARRELATPLYTSGASHYLGPADFRTIYDLDGLPSSLDGSGAKIAIIGRTQVRPEDLKEFRTFFGLPAKDPQVIVNGPDPGVLSDDNETGEALLDVQWSGAVSPNADVLFVVSKSTNTDDGIDLSIQYAVEHDVADIVSVSFGLCERDIGAPSMAYYDDIWAQAAAQGMSVFIASGDSGVAGCDSAGASRGTVAGVNGLASTPWTSCVGGTIYLDKSSPSTYWKPSHDPSTKSSALSYIPEGVWNESGAVTSGRGLLATGGGVSNTFKKPAWQVGPGVPADGWRDVPDVSLAAAGHTGYLVVQGYTGQPSGWLWIVSGTSASSPAFAGIAAALVQKTGGRLGNLNPTLYALGAAQYGGSGVKVFHDVMTGDNGVPGVTGFAAGTGYDLSTGLGSVDVAVLAQAWASMAPPANLDFLVDVSPGALAMTPTGKSTISIALRTLTGGDTMVRLTLSGLPSAMSASFQPSQSSTLGTTGYASAGAPGKLTLTGHSGLANGTYPITLTASSGSVQRSVTIYVTVSGSATIPPASGTETQVPVVLDVFGAASSHYTSDLVAVNRGTDATLQLRFAGGTATGPIVSASLPAGRQLYVPDVIAFLTANGYSFPDTKLGTLYATFVGVSDPSLVFAGSRISTPNLDTSVGGAFGTFAAAVPSGTASTGDTWIYGLKKNAAFRSSVAVVHAPNASASLSGGSPISVEVQIYDGATGAAAGVPIAHTLQVGEFWQIDPFQFATTTQSGYARVRRTAGTDRFITYGVVNDGGSAGGGTSDGSLIVSGGTDGVVPIVLDIPGSPHYQTEISLTNTTTHSVNVSLVYTASPVWGASFSQSASVAIPAGQQIQQPNAITWLRGLGIAIPASGPQGGTLQVTGAVAVARTWQPASGGSGTYGVAYPALDAAHRATGGAWVYGLRQDSNVRTNLAIADARVGDPSTRDYTVDLYDADSGSATPAATLTKTLAGGEWWQFNALLGDAGVTHGYARVRASTASDFIVYGVVNDGPGSGSRTSDGSYVPMAVSSN